MKHNMTHKPIKLQMPSTKLSIVFSPSKCGRFPSPCRRGRALSGAPLDNPRQKLDLRCRAKKCPGGLEACRGSWGTNVRQCAGAHGCTPTINLSGGKDAGAILGHAAAG